LHTQKPETKNLTLTQDVDVLDTWFSSWLWPMEVFHGITKPNNEELKYYYPTSVLVTGQDIIFFWVARMIMAGMEYEQVKPFSDVYFTGMVRDKLGRKMSKSLGNSPDLLNLIDQFGADAVRFGIMISSPAGNDLLFDEAALEQGKFFNNKIWNALKLVKLWEIRQSDTLQQDQDDSQFAIQWFENRLNAVKAEVETLMKQFRLSEALKTIYSLIWDDFCSWYLEWIKPGFEQPIQSSVYRKTLEYFAELMQLLHPYMPFITEEIYHSLEERSDDLCVKQFAIIKNADRKILEKGAVLKESITAVRDARNKAQLKPKEEIELFIQTSQQELYGSLSLLLGKQVNAKSIQFSDSQPAASIAVVMGKEKFYIISEQPINTGQQKEDLLKELEYLKGFLTSVEKKTGE
jgi:valyl-tRNA synthetase